MSTPPVPPAKPKRKATAQPTLNKLYFSKSPQDGATAFGEIAPPSLPKVPNPVGRPPAKKSKTETTTTPVELVDLAAAVPLPSTTASCSAAPAVSAPEVAASASAPAATAETSRGTIPIAASSSGSQLALAQTAPEATASVADAAPANTAPVATKSATVKVFKHTWVGKVRFLRARASDMTRSRTLRFAKLVCSLSTRQQYGDANTTR